MKIGSVFFEKYLDSQQTQAHLNWLLDQKLTHLEFTVHDKLLNTQTLFPLIRQARGKGLTVSYHSPDFVDPQHFSLFGLSQPHAQKQTLTYFETLLENANQALCPFVIHGLGREAFLEAKGYLPDDDELATFNLKALDQLLNWLSQYHLPLKLCFENTAPQDGTAYGQTPETLIKLHQSFFGEHFGFCIDLSHLWRSAMHHHLSPEHFFETISLHPLDIEQFHLHGFSTHLKTSHIGLKDTDEDFITFVKAIHSKKLKKTFVLECFFLAHAKNLAEYESLLLQDIELF